MGAELTDFTVELRVAQPRAGHRVIFLVLSMYRQLDAKEKPRRNKTCYAMALKLKNAITV
jgi:hypothetical protein